MSWMSTTKPATVVIAPIESYNATVTGAPFGRSDGPLEKEGELIDNSIRNGRSVL